MDNEPARETGFLEPRQLERAAALVDMIYLMQVTWLYVFSLIYPVIGLFFGILLLTGSISEKSKKVGRICLILGIINTVLVVAMLGVVLALGLAGALGGVLPGD
ncbi:hypothetical protein FJY69_04660 [candidate division WOR-3 bacterium]|nr:hypothetical protein [candidate division WOR-3 bacterium]